jgi:hypothetical protein
MRPSYEHPTFIGKDEPLSKTERLVFGDAPPGCPVRCPSTGRPYEHSGNGYAEQSALFVAESELGRSLSPLEAQMVLQKVRAGK